MNTFVKLQIIILASGTLLLCSGWSALKISLSSELVKEKVPDNYLIYERFGGRISNQVWQLTSALQLATILDRTLVIPYEMRPTDFTGMFHKELNIWDLSELKNEFNYIFEHEFNQPRVATPECTFEAKTVLAARYESMGCEIISIGGATGMSYCKKGRFCGNAVEEHMAFRIMQLMKPAQHIRRAIANYPSYSLGVHSRSFLGSKNLAICPFKSKEMLNAHLMQKDWGDKRLKQMIDGMCRTREPGAMKQLSKMYNKTFTGQSDLIFSIDYPQFEVPGGRRIPILKYNKIDLKDIKFYGHKPKKKEIENVMQILFEQGILAKTKFFFGNIYSSLSYKICVMRGYAKRWESNICGLLLHPSEYKIDVEDYWQNIS